jgi:hypothetical protein
VQVKKKKPGIETRSSFTGLFIKIDILASSQYSLPMMLFVIDNQNNFQIGFNVHGLDTRNKNQLHIPTADLCSFSEGSHLLWYQNI